VVNSEHVYFYKVALGPQNLYLWSAITNSLHTKGYKENQRLTVSLLLVKYNLHRYDESSAAFVHRSYYLTRI